MGHRDFFRDAHSRSGVALVYVIIGIVVFAFLAAGIASFVSTSTVGSARINCAKRATYIAESGIRYVMAELRAAADSDAVDAAISDMNGTRYTLSGDGGDFQLLISDNRPSFTVSSVGRACTGDSAASTSKTVEYTFNVPDSVPGGDDQITFDEDFDNFDVTGEKNDAIVKDTDEKTFILGNNKKQAFGCIWYRGDIGTCESGLCDFEKGIRARFYVTFSNTDLGDGFTFAIKSGATNSWNSCGGETFMGELMGYGGRGVLGQGISPPKLGTEFDVYLNRGSGNICSSNSRRDYSSGGSSHLDHVAFVYWGSLDDGCSSQGTFDDNRHGAGRDIETEPRNGWNWNEAGNGGDAYYYRSDSRWLKRGSGGNRTTEVRLEIHRSETVNKAGNYLYHLRGWFRQAGDTIESEFNDMSADFDATPDIIDTIALNPTYHGQLNKIYFGWTTGTGAATQFATLGNAIITFRHSDQSEPGDWDNKVPTDYSAAWKLDEGADDRAYNEVSGGPTGNIENDNPSTGELFDSEWVAGLPVSRTAALRQIFFSRNNRPGRVVLNDNNALDLTPNGSVSLWFNPVELVRNDRRYGLLQKGERFDHNGEIDYDLRLLRRGNRFELLGIVGYEFGFSYDEVDVRSSTTLNNDDTNQWHHAVLTWQGQTVSLYLNGVLEDTETLGRPGFVPTNSSYPLIIGALRAFTGSSSNNYAINGVIDEVHLFKRQLSAAEITAIYNAGQ